MDVLLGLIGIVLLVILFVIQRKRRISDAPSKVERVEKKSDYQKLSNEDDLANKEINILKKEIKSLSKKNHSLEKEKNELNDLIEKLKIDNLNEEIDSSNETGTDLSSVEKSLKSMSSNIGLVTFIIAIQFFGAIVVLIFGFGAFGSMFRSLL